MFVVVVECGAWLNAWDNSFDGNGVLVLSEPTQIAESEKISKPGKILIPGFYLVKQHGE